MRADNTSVITLMLDPPGPPRAEVLRNKRNSYSSSGLQIETRYQEREEEKSKPTEAPQEENNFNGKFNESAEKDAKPDTDISKIDKCVKEVDKKFIPKPRESTAFDTRPPESSDNYKDENDIQINEVSSSCVDEVSRTKPSKKNPKSEKVLRNLRSSVLSKGEISSTKIVPNESEKRKSEEKKIRPPLGENVPETSRNECRVLRERKNTPNDKNPVQKKKFGIKKKLNLSAEKKKLLQNVLFRGKEAPGKVNGKKTWMQKDKLTTPSKNENASKTKEISRVLRNSDKNKNNILTKKKEVPAVSSAEVKVKKSEVKTKAKVEVREVRKSTLAQKLRMQKEVFKAKLRVRPPVPAKITKDKVMRFKKSVAKRS